MIFFSTMDYDEPNTKHHKKIIIEEDIFIKIAENDKTAFEELYHLTERVLYAFILSILKNHDETLDVLQETYLKIRSAAHLYKPMGKPMAWIFTIARNLAMNSIRTHKYMEQNEINDLEDDITYSYVTNPMDKIILKSAMSILNDVEREIILLHAISGFKHIEISRNLDIPLSTVLSKYHRGIKKLKKYLMEQEVQ